MDPVLRETLGKRVRQVWIKWANAQPNPKPSWLVPWEGLGEPDKEADRMIGEDLYQAGYVTANALRAIAGGVIGEPSERAKTQF